MKAETRMQRIMHKASQMKTRGKVSSDERHIKSDLAMQGHERDVVNLATFIHNAKVDATNS